MSSLAKSGNFFPLYEEETRLRRIIEALNSLATYVFTKEVETAQNPLDYVVALGGTGAPIPGWKKVITVPIRAQSQIWFIAVVECSVYAAGAGCEIWVERTNESTGVKTKAATALWDPGIGPAAPGTPLIQSLVGIGSEADLIPGTAATPPQRYTYQMRASKLLGGGATYTVLAANSDLIIKTEGLVL